MMEQKIIIAGFGGQGVVLAGNILAYAALEENKNILGMVSYGAEMRGGASSSSVIISDKEIDCPIIDQATHAITMSQEAYDKYADNVDPKGFIIIDSSKVKAKDENNDVNVIKIPAIDIAYDMGNIKVVNIILLGALIEKTKIVKKESVLKAFEKTFSGKKRNLIYINASALEKGMELAR